MRKLTMKRKRDWVIAFLFTALIVYGVTNYYSYHLQNVLLEIGDFRMTNVNQPQSFGNVIVTILVMTALTLLVLWIQKKPFRMKAGIVFGGVLLAAAVLGGYFFYCRLIISAADTEEPVRISIGRWGSAKEEVSEEQEQKLTEYCASLAPVDKGLQKELEEQFYMRGGASTGDSVLIWITYPRRYGHRYDLMVCVYEDMIYIRKGYNNDGKELVTFCRDNGLLDLIDEIMEIKWVKPESLQG